MPSKEKPSLSKNTGTATGFQLILIHNEKIEIIPLPAKCLIMSPYLLRKSKAHRQVELSYKTARSFNDEVKNFLLFGRSPQIQNFLEDDILRLSILFCMLELYDTAKQLIYEMKGAAFNQLKRKIPA